VTTVSKYYKAILWTNFESSRRINLDTISFPFEYMSTLDVCFSEAEVWSVICDIPANKALGTDRFMGLFYKWQPWHIVKDDIDRECFQCLLVTRWRELPSPKDT
jgi:hypothetical protein